MFVVYPHICITAAVTLSTSLTLIVSFMQNIRFIVIFWLAHYLFPFVVCYDLYSLIWNNREFQRRS
jgi:hypothetical protein